MPKRRRSLRLPLVWIAHSWCSITRYAFHFTPVAICQKENLMRFPTRLLTMGAGCQFVDIDVTRDQGKGDEETRKFSLAFKGPRIYLGYGF